MLYRLYVTSCVLYVFIKTDMENIILDIFLNLSKAFDRVNSENWLEPSLFGYTNILMQMTPTCW